MLGKAQHGVKHMKIHHTSLQARVANNWNNSKSQLIDCHCIDARPAPPALNDNTVLCFPSCIYFSNRKWQNAIFQAPYLSELTADYFEGQLEEIPYRDTLAVVHLHFVL
jgi:hypothetical protein